MGSCSNRSDTREERIGKYAKEIIKANRTQSYWQDNYGKFQSTIGARIRGEMGERKGNEFIKDIRKYRR